ncbi:hypothetical protein E3N88_19615 [Mikania micrantha]|uniref:Cyclin-like domain-containing protein n=1 Tax=Mikania micrantha TaxID=192012 RepID=A0A5N6NQ23_9ASTR|nr:hypothetical protein E3N88_19615 [Mikania micrantha]
MKKFRSKLPRRRRSKYSPACLSYAAVKLGSTSVIDSASNLTRDVAFSCDSFCVSTNTKSVKKRSFVDGNGAGAGEFRRITRSYSKGMDVEFSESSSCVELCDSSAKNVIRKRPAVFRFVEAENYDETSVAICGIENSEITTRSECSVFPKEVTDGIDDLQGNEEIDVVSVFSRRESPQAKLSDTPTNEGQSAYSNEKEYADSVASCLQSRPTPKSGEITSYINNSFTNNIVTDDQAENYVESKLISADLDLTCSEHFSCGDEESNYSSTGCTDANTDSYEFDFSSGYTTSSLCDSGSQFSERSVGDPIPSPTFQLFLIYSKKFCKSEFSTRVFSEHNYNEHPNRIIKLLIPEDEEHEETYQMLKKRERRQVYLHDYAEKYCVTTEYGDLVVQQRLQMVHWIMEQSANKGLQEETMFLGVNLLDRFLSKGYFRSKTELEIAGIACLTLATRIEENQPYNSIQQKLFNVGSNEYTRSEVVAMEWLVQEVLNFQCYLPTIYNFLWFYLKAVRSDEDVEKTAKYLAVLALLGHEQLCYWPSTVAASLVTLACLAENEQSSLQQITRIHNRSDVKDLPDCIKVTNYKPN